MEQLTSEQIRQKISNNETFLLKMMATWCGPCKIMLNNLTNFFNLITSKMIKKVPEATDLIALGTKDPRYYGQYKPTGIQYQDLKKNLDPLLK